jgi:hypothetical protein
LEKEAKQAPAQLPPLESLPKVGYCSVCGESVHQTPYGTVCKNGHGGAEILDQPRKKETPVKPILSAPLPSSADKPGKSIDFSSIDPEKEWECFGTIDKNHPECQECPFAKRCEDKKNSKVKKG